MPKTYSERFERKLAVDLSYLFGPRPAVIPVGLCQCGCGAATSLASRDRRKDGVQTMVKGQPRTYVQGHCASTNLRLHWEEEPETGCWIWQGAIRETGPKRVLGYGRTRARGHLELAHRVVYEILRGPVDARLQLDHLCRVPSCVNPDHLEPVPAHVNTRRGLVGKLSEAEYALLEDRAHVVSVWDFAALAEEMGLAPVAAYSLILRAQRRGDLRPKEKV